MIGRAMLLGCTVAGLVLVSQACTRPAGEDAETRPAPAPIPPPDASAPRAVDSEGALASRRANGLIVDLVELQRTGSDTLSLRWRYRAESDDVASIGGTDPYAISASAYLVDPAHEKKYLVVRDAAGQPIASALEAGQLAEFEAGTPLEAWAKFPAPSPSVETITVKVPHVPAFENVPVPASSP